MTRTREARRKSAPERAHGPPTAALPDDEVRYLSSGPALDGNHASFGLRRSPHIQDPEDGESERYVYTGRFNDD